MAQTRIFISYRRDDTADEVVRLKKSLERTQESVFLDTSNIQAGERFPKKLENALSEADVTVVVIGKNWLHASDWLGNRRLDDPDDFVRREIIYSLRRKESDPFFDIIPVLMPGAKMPRAADLPDELEPLLEFNASRIDGKHFDRSVNELSKRIDEFLGEHEERADAELDELDDFLTAKDTSLSDRVSLSPTFARDPDLHDLPDAAEWMCTQQDAFALRFETFDDLYFEGQLSMPGQADVEVEGNWAYKPGPDKTVVMRLSGRTAAGADFNAFFPIQEKVGRRSYGGWDDDGQYYRLQCLRTKNALERHF